MCAEFKLLSAKCVPAKLSLEEAEEDNPRPERVFRFQHHYADQKNKEKRRHQDGTHQSHTFPHHVHEDGDDQPCLQEHEGNNKEPPQKAFKADIVDEIGACAEYEQQRPDLEIYTEGMLLPVIGNRFRSGLGSFLRHLVFVCPLPEIEESEDEYPNKVDEMPIQTGDLDDFVIAFGFEIAPHDLNRDRGEIYYAD